MDLLEQAKKALEAEGVTFAAVSSCGEKKTSQKKGIAPMMEILAECPEFLQGAAVADQVIGKAAAFLLRKGGAKYLYAKIISEHALETLQNSGIAVSYGTKVPYIINRNKDGAFCDRCGGSLWKIAGKTAGTFWKELSFAPWMCQSIPCWRIFSMKPFFCRRV